MSGEPRTIRELKTALDAAGVNYRGLTLKADLLQAYRADLATRKTKRNVHGREPAPRAKSGTPTTIREYREVLGRAGIDYSRLASRSEYKEAYEEWLHRAVSPPSSEANITATGREAKTGAETSVETHVISASRPPAPQSERKSAPKSERKSETKSAVARREAGTRAEIKVEAERLRWEDVTLGAVVRDMRDRTKAFRLVRYIAAGAYGRVWVALPYSLVRTAPAPAPSVAPSSQVMTAVYAEVEAKHAAESVAIKLIWIDPDAQGGLHPETLSEVALQKHLEHPNVLSVITTLTYRGPTQEYLGVVMPLERENLHSALTRWNTDWQEVGRDEDVRRRLRMIRDVGCGVAYMTANGFAHLDLKPQNVLVGANGVGRIADLGMARLVAGAKLGRATDDLVTSWWRPPELWSGLKDYTARVDDWSLGCIVYELAFRLFPFRRDPETGSTMADVGAKLGFPSSFRNLLRRGPTDERVLRPQIELLQTTADAGRTPRTLDLALMPKESDRDYYKTYYGATLYAELWNYLFDLLRVDPRLRRNDGLASPTLFLMYPCRVAPPKHDALMARISDTDAYPVSSYPLIRPLTREYAQFLWNRLVAEKSVPDGEATLWWLATLALACKLMDEPRSAIKVPLEGGIEDALMAALDDPWRGFLIDIDSETRRGRVAPFTVAAPYAPPPPRELPKSSKVGARRKSPSALPASPLSPELPHLTSSPLTPLTPLQPLPPP
jgi:serine/threonine protein kinase